MSMYIKKYGLRLSLEKKNAKPRNSINITAKIVLDDTDKYLPEVFDWLFNGNSLLMIDGIFNKFTIDKEDEIFYVIDDIKSTFKTDKEIIIAELMNMTNLFADYLEEIDYPLIYKYNETLWKYHNLSNVNLELQEAISENALSLTKEDNQNGVVLFLITQRCFLDVVEYISTIENVIASRVKELYLKQVTLHYLCDFNLKQKNTHLSKTAKRMIHDDNAVLEMYELSEGKALRLKHLIQITGLRFDKTLDKDM